MPFAVRFFALEGLSALLQTVEQVQHQLNPNLSITYRAADVRGLAQNQFVEPVVGRCQTVNGGQGLQNHDPAQCPILGGTSEQAGAWYTISNASAANKTKATKLRRQ